MEIIISDINTMPSRKDAINKKLRTKNCIRRENFNPYRTSIITELK